MKSQTEVCLDDDSSYLKVKLPFRKPKQTPVANDPEPVGRVEEPVVAEVTPPAQIPASRIARRLALAYAIERYIETGEVRNFAEVSRRFGISRPRVTQIMSLIHLAAPVQEAILIGKLSVSERTALRKYGSKSWNFKLWS